MKRNWIAVVAAATNGVIGRDQALPWRLSSDLQRFKSLTMGHCLLMGRKTFQSIGKALPGRKTIVLSRGNFTCDDPAVAVTNDLNHVESLALPNQQIMVVGGAQLYQATLAFWQEIWLTRVLVEVPGDTFFPEVDWNAWHCINRESVPAGPRDQWPTEFQRWCKR